MNFFLIFLRNNNILFPKIIIFRLKFLFKKIEKKFFIFKKNIIFIYKKTFFSKEKVLE